MSEKYVDPNILASTTVVALMLLAWTINAYVSASPPSRAVYEEDIIDQIVAPVSSTTTTITTVIT